jgi:hypothetical protein
MMISFFRHFSLPSKIWSKGKRENISTKRTAFGQRKEAL